MTERLILWDFDGTLAHRTGMWRGAMIDVLDTHRPGHGVASEHLRPYLRDAFPWHRAHEPHLELAEPEAWWAPIHAVMARAYEGVGIAAAEAARLAHAARAHYLDPAHGWALFDDTLEVLGHLRDEGWRHALLSNHVPELGQLIERLGLDQPRGRHRRCAGAWHPGRAGAPRRLRSARCGESHPGTDSALAVVGAGSMLAQEVLVTHELGQR